MMDNEGAVQEAESCPDMNGHPVMPITPDAAGTAACNGVHPDQASEGSNNMTESPAEAPEVPPEVYKDMPELVSDDEGDDLPIPTFQTDEEWRHAILNSKVKGADFIRAGQIIPESVFDLNENAATDKATPGTGTRANGQANQQATKDRGKKGAPTDVEWLQKMEDNEGAVQEAESCPDMNGHPVMPITPDADGTAACNGVHPDQASEGSNNTTESPAEAPEVPPEVYKDMPELVSDDEGDDLPIPTFQTDEEWRHAILNFKVKGADFIRAGQIISGSVFDLDGNAATDKATPGTGTRANGQANQQAAKDRGKKGAPTDVEWLQKMEMEEQEKQGGKLSAEETSRRKAAAEAEVQRNLELDREARQRLRAEHGLVGRENVILAHCVLRPGVVEGAVCEKADDGCAIRGSEKYLKVACTEGCTIYYHYGCWRAFERVHKTEYTDFSWKSKDRIKCFTDGCDGVIKLALELQFDSGIEISRKELLKLPDEPKKAAPAPAQPAEPRKKANKQKPAQKAPAANADEGTAKLDRPTRQAMIDRAAVTPSPDPAPEAKVEPKPPVLDFPEVNFVQKRRDEDEDDLKRLEMGLKGKKEKKKREKKGKAPANIVMVHPEAGYDGGEYDQEPAPVQSYAENFHAVEEPEPEPVPVNTSNFPRLGHAALPAAQSRMAAKTKEPSESRHTSWETLLALKSGSGMTAHLLIQNVDMQGLEKAGKAPAAEVEDAVSIFGPFTALVFLPGYSAAVVTYLSPRFAEMAYFKLDGQLLAKKKVQLSFLERFPAEDLIVSLAEESGKPALKKRTSAEKHFREIGGQGAGPSAGSGSGITSSAAAAAKPGTTDKDKLTLKGLMKGAELLGLAPAAANSATKLRVAARESVPPTKTASDASDDKHGSRHVSLDGAPLTAPSPESAGPSEAVGPDAHDIQLEEDMAAISCLHVLGCDEDCLAHYNSNPRFGVSLEDLAEHAEHDVSSTGLVLYHIDTHELHGLWRTERVTQGGQVMAFRELQRFPPLSRNMYAEVLERKEDGSLDHPQCLTGSVVQRCIQKFNAARTLASSSGDNGMRSIAAAIKTAAAPGKAGAALTPDAPPFQPGSAAPSGGLSFPGFTPHDNNNPPPRTAVLAAPAVPAPTQPPAAQPVPAVQAPAAQAPATAAAPLNPMAALFSNLFPRENPVASAPAQPAQPTAQPITQPPSPEQVPASAANAAGTSASRGDADPDRVARLAAFYRTPHASPETKAQISQHLQSAGLGRKPSPETSPSASQLPPPAGLTVSPAPEPTPAAAPHIPGVTGGASGSTAAAAAAPSIVATQGPAVALPMPAASTVARPAAAKPPVRLVPPSGRPAYLPPTAAPRPYRPPAAPAAPPAPAAPRPAPAPALPNPQQQQDEPQQQRQQQAGTAPHLPSFTEMLLSNIQQAAPAPAVAGRPAPTTRAPAAAPVPPPVKESPRPSQPAKRPPYAPPPAQGVAKAEPSQAKSVSSEAASDTSSGDRSNKPKCRLCQEQDAVYVVLDCKHWGPCSDCVPTAQDKSLYPTCLDCGGATKLLFRAYLH